MTSAAHDSSRHALEEAPIVPPGAVQRLALAAYTAVYQQHHRGLLRYARTLTGDRHLAEDLVAEAHLRVWQRIAAGHRIDDPRAYLATTVRNLATVPREAVDPFPAEPGPAPGADPADRVAEVARLRDLLGRLPERWAQVLWLAEVEDLSLEEVGARLGLRRNAAGVLLHRAREGLRTAYLGDYPGTPADPECAAYWAVIPPHVRGAAPARRARLLTGHVRECTDCADRLDRLRRVNRRLTGLIGPAVLLSGLGAGGAVAVAGGPAWGIGAAAAVLGGAMALMTAGTPPTEEVAGVRPPAVPSAAPRLTADPAGTAAARSAERPTPGPVRPPATTGPGSGATGAPAPGATAPGAAGTPPTAPAPPSPAMSLPPGPGASVEPGRAPGGGASPSTTAGGPEQVPGGCEVGYLVISQWEGRFVVQLRIRNTGPGAVTGWRLVWPLAAGQHVVASWYGTTGEQDGSARLTDAGWNARIDPGQAVDSGFEGSWAGENPAPAVMYLNGTACAVVPK
ncbi:sigma-70 family RNA polymerase sigma factor [Kitasatospora sp. NPDC048365]|uniref:sigma-70 family RNA polymerase sigma factor n=1 Tax=Kitasatospora sp. NPDC048365 TaxID=3364050 RepID=UPI0037226D64